MNMRIKCYGPKSIYERWRFFWKNIDRIDEIEVFGDTHDIQIAAPKDIIDMLVDQELARCC